MDYKKELMQTHGFVLSKLATHFLTYKEGDKIPTINSLSKIFQVGHGTIQTALNKLKSLGAINTESRGHKGTILTEVNFNQLLIISGKQNFIGAMPLPYSKRFEGLATGLSKVLNQENIYVNFAFMTGSKNRIKSLLEDRYDFVVLSKHSAHIHLKDYEELEIVSELYDQSFIGNHVFIVHKNFKGSFEKIRIGIDLSSTDQCEITMKYFEGKNVQLIPIRYSNIIQSIEANIIDGAIWSKENIKLPKSIVKIEDIIEHVEDKAATRAVIVVKKDNIPSKTFLKKYLDGEKIKEIQEKVLMGEMLPNY